jgi:Fe2+ transport system protein FeoA
LTGFANAVYRYKPKGQGRFIVLKRDLTTANGKERNEQVASSTSELSAIKTGQRAVVSAIKSCPKDLLHKFVSMGLVAGTEVEVTQRGFFGSPINIHLLGSVLSLRSAEAAHIQVQPL